MIVCPGPKAVETGMVVEPWLPSEMMLLLSSTAGQQICYFGGLKVRWVVRTGVVHVKKVQGQSSASAMTKDLYKMRLAHKGK